MKRSLLKKLIVLTLSIAMLLNALPLMVASAAETATITATADKSSYAVGDTVVVDVAVSEVTVKSIGLSWTYDDAVLEFVSAAWALTGAIADVEEDAPRAAFAYDEATATAGKIFTLTFTVLKDAEDTSVVVTPVLKNGTAVIAAESATATVSFACKHENIGDWEKDATNHWKSCECGEAFEFGAHVYDNDCDANCNTCGYVREVAGHVYDNDCDTDCNTCGETRMVGDHVYDNACDANCNNCGATREVGDHAYGDYQSTEDGHFKVCTECSNQTATEPHVYDNACDFDCNVCGATRNVDGHEFSETYSFDENGHWFACSICGEKTDVLPHAFDNDCDAKCDTCGYTREVAGHQFGAYEYNDLTHWQTCSICGVTQNAGDHVFGEWVTDVEATVNAAGSKYRECSCGATQTKRVPKKLKMNSVSLTLQSNISVNFMSNVTYETVEGYSDLYAVFVKKGVETVVPMDKNKIDTEDNRYIFTFKMNPQSMNDDFDVYLYGTYDGELYCSDVLVYNIVQKYCYNQLRKAGTTTEYKSLFATLLNYSAACQIKQNYNIENLSNASMTDAEKALAIVGERPTGYVDCQNTKYVVIDNPTAKFNAVGLVLSDAVVIEFEATLPNDNAGAYLKAVYDNGKTVQIMTIDEFEYNTSNNRHVISFNKLGAHLMSEQVQFTLCDSEGNAISNTFLYSIETFTARNLAKYKTQDPKLANVLIAMHNYGDAAVVYRNSVLK